MDMVALREWLIAKGIRAEELDQVIEPPVIRDIGEGLTLSLINDDDIGEMLVQIMIKQEEQDARIAALEGGGA